MKSAKNYGIYLDNEFHSRATSFCKKTGRNFSALVKISVVEYMERNNG